MHILFVALCYFINSENGVYVMIKCYLYILKLQLYFLFGAFVIPDLSISLWRTRPVEERGLAGILRL